MLLNFPANGGAILQTNIWEIRIQICGFLCKSTILKFDRLPLLASIFSLLFIETVECQTSSSYRASKSRFFPYIHCKFCRVCPTTKMTSATVKPSMQVYENDRKVEERYTSEWCVQRNNSSQDIVDVSGNSLDLKHINCSVEITREKRYFAHIFPLTVTVCLDATSTAFKNVTHMQENSHDSFTALLFPILTILLS